mgnify:CR=1 FL=1
MEQYWFVLHTYVWSFTHVAPCDNIGDNLTCHPEFNSGSINADVNIAKQEPSPAFVTFADAHEQLLPLTKREGNNFNDADFSRFTSHFSLKSVAFTLKSIT